MDQMELFAGAVVPRQQTKVWLTTWDENLTRMGLPRLNQAECKILVRNLTTLVDAAEVPRMIGAWFGSPWGNETGYSVQAFVAGRRALLLRMRGERPLSANQSAFQRVARDFGHG